jgi:tetratricopeptide (TPR) repeat protein
MDHLTDSEVEGFLGGILAKEAFLRTVRHLVSGCRACGGRIAAKVPRDAFLPKDPPPTAGERDAYDDAIDRAWKKVRPLVRRWKEDQGRLERGLEWLGRSPAGFSGLTAPQRQSLVPWVHVEILLQRSFEARYRNPQQMLYDADRAKYVAERIEKTPYGPGFLADLRCRAWIELANAYRVNENYRLAEPALRWARQLLEKGTGDLMLTALLDEVQASLRKAQRRFSEACTLHEEAYRAYKKLGERHLSGRVLASQGITLALSRKPREATKMFQRALPLLDASRDPGLFTSTQYNLLDALVDAGDLHGAVRLLVQTDLREKLSADPLNRLRVRWVEGKILARQKRYGEAEKVFAEVRAGFREQNLEYVACMAGVDQTTMLVREKRLNDAHLVARDLFAVFYQQIYTKDLDAEEALKALSFLASICGMKLVTVPMVEAVRAFLDESQRDRGLRFDMSGVLRQWLPRGDG